MRLGADYSFLRGSFVCGVAHSFCADHAFVAFNLGSLMTLESVSLSLRRRLRYEFGCVASAV